MNILIIDDDITFSKKIYKDISMFLHKFNSKIKIKIYNSDFFNINFNDNYRLAFIDIDLKQINGILLSKKIKQYNFNCDIVFISAKNNLIHSSLSVQPFFFIRKSNYNEDLYIFYELVKNSLSNKTMIQISCKSTKITIPVKNIIYIESIQHILTINSINTKQYRDNRSLKEFASLLPANYFIQIHKSFLINCKYIYSISRGSVILYKNINNKDEFIKLRISRSYQKEFENKYQEYLLLWQKLFM